MAGVQERHALSVSDYGSDVKAELGSHASDVLKKVSIAGK
jgi:hypothetical protein